MKTDQIIHSAPCLSGRIRRLSGSGFSEKLKEEQCLCDMSCMPRSQGRQPCKTQDSGLVCIGTISRKRPTVSHLLIRHPEFGKDCWKIINSGLNRNKNYRGLQTGKAIYIDPATSELIWGEGRCSARYDKTPCPCQEDKGGMRPALSDPFCSTPQDHYFDPVDLSAVLKGYIGTPYRRLNCFELVVQGLKGMGVCYRGKEGLQDRLIKRALDKGLPMNSYLTGEGLIDNFSKRVYKRKFEDVSRAEEKGELLLSEIKNELEPGMIVSFSTSKRGHIGVVSNHKGRWTFLNSGVIDNGVEGTVKIKGVGEEDLKAEFVNWFRLAEGQHSPLTISLGRLDREKLLPFVKPGSLNISV